jgi:hypothetical protein
MEAPATARDPDTLCVDIVEAVAGHADVDPLSLTPLGTVIDPGALDDLVTTATDVQVSFEYEEYTVSVHADASVSIDGNEGDDAADGGQ